MRGWGWIPIHLPSPLFFYPQNMTSHTSTIYITVKVQTPLARLRHCGDTSGPPGPTCTLKGTRRDK